MRNAPFVDRAMWAIHPAIVVAFTSVLACSAGAQAVAGHVHPVAATPAADDANYLAAARQATIGLETPEAARAAGYVPVFGTAPLQGEHYARPDLVMRDSFDLRHPSVVMFARVGSQSKLVGVAYTFYLPVDRMSPRGWTGPKTVWHAHDDIARIPGKHIVMMHVWLVESPLGVLAHDNPWLPYFAAEVAPPPIGTASDTSAMGLTRRVGLALALVTEPPTLIDLIQRNGEASVGEQATLVKNDIGLAAARLRSAQASGDSAATNAARADLAARADSLVGLYREGASKSPGLRDGLAVLVDMYLGRAKR